MVKVMSLLIKSESAKVQFLSQKIWCLVPVFLFFSLRSVHRSSASVYYTERKPKNKNGGPGNEATLKACVS